MFRKIREKRLGNLMIFTAFAYKSNVCKFYEYIVT